MHIPRIPSFLNERLAIDLGSSRVRVWSAQYGDIVDEICAIAVDQGTHKVVAVGREAAEMVGRVGKHIQVIFPLSHDGIGDGEMVKVLLKSLLERTLRIGLFFRPVMVVSVHSGLGEPERQQLTKLLFELGARQVYLVDELLAAAIGSGVPIADASGSVFLHSGAGVTEVGSISLGSLIVFESSLAAGEQHTRILQQILKTECGLFLGRTRVEQLKHALLGQEHPPAQLRVAGQDVESRQLREILLAPSALGPFLESIVEQYAAQTTRLMTKIPPELAQDVLEKGMLLSGGAVQLTGLAQKLAHRLGFPVAVVEKPDRVALLGLAQVAQHLSLFTESIGYRPVQ